MPFLRLPTGTRKGVLDNDYMAANDHMELTWMFQDL